jgi:hypothetical protein
VLSMVYTNGKVRVTVDNAGTGRVVGSIGMPKFYCVRSYSIVYLVVA